MSEDPIDAEFFRPAARESARIARRRSITDRQATAQRFLFEAADEVYDGELDINWDAPPDPDRSWLPPQVVTLHGTSDWERLTTQERIDLSRHELVNLLTLSTYAQNALAMLTFRQIAEDRDLVDDRSRWLLKCVNTQTRNVTMFGRLIDTTGVKPRTRPRLTRRLERLTLLVPAGAVTSTLVLLLESATQDMIALAASDRDVVPHVGQIMTITALSSRRHLEYARSEFEAAVAHRGILLRTVCSILAALLIVCVGRLFVDRQSYQAIGLPAAPARQAARRSPSYRLRMASAFGTAVDIGAEAGLFADPASRALLRAGRAPVPRRRAG
ncbi:diiron oxygenase [Gordonia alkanivorans]|uniref:Uncharacterized protein n=1 Tax=Gordonia alkanivorans NBRC 16433 TaxID=1027371 RepID=F9W248_9ACTN|nr:diiron oxygenase [Gordonia alkanivorans]GAA14908.1 hypothetical protein GOALK_118_00260 [Gordonia alkanivorans NBRC 16433]